MDPGQPSTSAPKRNIYRSKILLCIWWDMKDVVYYELLKLNQTVTAEHYQQHLIESCFESKTSNNSSKKTQNNFIAQQYSTTCCKRLVKNALSALQWKVLLYATYSPDCVPYNLFWSMRPCFKTCAKHAQIRKNMKK